MKATMQRPAGALTKAQRKAIEDVLRHADMATASFGWDKVTTSHNAMDPDGRAGNGTVDVDVTEFVRRRTRIWRETWLIEPLRAILAADDANWNAP